MHDTYISSSLFSLRTNGSLSFSLNECSNLFNERFEKNPLFASSCRGCCSCSCSCCGSSCASCRVHINPSLCYGLRQSSLIQWSPSRMWILGGKERYYCRVPGYGIDNCDCKVSCSFKDRSDGSVERRGKGKWKGRLRSVNSSGRQWFSGVDHVDAVISLLSEEVSEECLGDGGRNWSSSNRMEVEKQESYGGEFHRAQKNNVRLEELESDSKYELVSVELRKERCDEREEREEKERRAERKEYRKRQEMEEKGKKEEQKAILRGENRRGQKASSSFSSYYSLSSSGEFESEKGAEEEHGDFLEESASRYGESRTRATRFEGKVEEEVKSHRDNVKGEKEVLEQRGSATRTGGKWDLRKKTEKKLTEIEGTQFRKEHSQLQSRIARIDESDYRKASSSYKQIDNEEAKSSLAVSLEKGTSKQFSLAASEVAEQSDFRQNYQQVTDIQEIHGKSSRITSQGQKLVLNRGENLSVDENLLRKRKDSHYKLDSERAGKDNLRKQGQNVIETSEIEKVDADRVSRQQRLPGSRMKIQGEDGAVIAAGDASELHYETSEKASRQTESRSSVKFRVTNAHDGHSKNASILQSGTSVKKEEGSTTVASSSGLESITRKPTRDQGNLQMIQLSQKSQDVSNKSVNVFNVSVVHAETVKDFQGTAEKTKTDQGNGSSPVVKPIRHPTDESIAPFKSTSEAQSANNMLGFHKGTSQETIGTESSVDVVSQLRVQQMGREHGDKISHQPMVLPPSVQLEDRGSLRSGSSQAVSEESLETDSGAWGTDLGWRTQASIQEPHGTDWRSEMYGKPLTLHSPEGVLGSAQRLEESSMQLVGEFIEKARHEASTSEIRKEKTISDTRLVHESEKIRQKNSDHYDSEGIQFIQFKEQDSRKSSGVSGVKGPSDEMWDVRDTSTRECQETESPEEGMGNENIVVRRTSKSLWNIISNVVRLHWGSHAEAPRSDRKSGGKSSSNDSVSSEAWFSGNEPDENSDENAKKERRNTPLEATSSDKLRRRQTSATGQGEVADTRKQIKSDASSPLVVLQSGSTSTGISNLGQNQGSKVVGISPSDMEIGSSSLISMASSGTTGIGEESIITGETAVFGGVSMTKTELPMITRSTNEQQASEGNEGELKQRKLERNKQILRDRYDAWEEAYVLESEQRKVDESFMREALLEAMKAADTWEVPVGAVLVQHGKIIARGYNLVEQLRDSTAHAEIICIREASNQLHSWRLAETTLYVTLEPCPMCAGAILQARIDTLVWGAPNKLLGADGSWIRLFPKGEGGNASELTDKPAAPVHPFHPNMKIRRGILASECADVMQQFFQLRRRKEKDVDPPPQPSCLPLANRQSKILTKMHDIFHAMLCM